ncbi:hypothetical protein H9P43_002001 [Blastocladiella emersonii ATCC 22665]|nr:hypothetical protein H9P43_002001 [Blastocladiella emersonii ATCC 22665]
MFDGFTVSGLVVPRRDQRAVLRLPHAVCRRLAIELCPSSLPNPPVRGDQVELAVLASRDLFPALVALDIQSSGDSASTNGDAEGSDSDDAGRAFSELMAKRAASIPPRQPTMDWSALVRPHAAHLTSLALEFPLRACPDLSDLSLPVLRSLTLKCSVPTSLPTSLPRLEQLSLVCRPISARFLATLSTTAPRIARLDVLGGFTGSSRAPASLTLPLTLRRVTLGGRTAVLAPALWVTSVTRFPAAAYATAQSSPAALDQVAAQFAGVRDLTLAAPLVITRGVVGALARIAGNLTRLALASDVGLEDLSEPSAPTGTTRRRPRPLGLAFPSLVDLRGPAVAVAFLMHHAGMPMLASVDVLGQPPSVTAAWPRAWVPPRMQVVGRPHDLAAALPRVDGRRLSIGARLTVDISGFPHLTRAAVRPGLADGEVESVTLVGDAASMARLTRVEATTACRGLAQMLPQCTRVAHLVLAALGTSDSDSGAEWPSLVPRLPPLPALTSLTLVAPPAGYLTLQAPSFLSFLTSCPRLASLSLPPSRTRLIADLANDDLLHPTTWATQPPAPLTLAWHARSARVWRGAVRDVLAHHGWQELVREHGPAGGRPAVHVHVSHAVGEPDLFVRTVAAVVGPGAAEGSPVVVQVSAQVQEEEDGVAEVAERLRRAGCAVAVKRKRARAW